MPDVTNQTQEQATAALKSAGFKVKSKQVDSQQQAGTVVDTNPAAGTQVATGSTVTIDVSNGSQQTFTMPSIVGMTQSQAQAQLRQQGWTGSFNVQQISTFDPGQDGMIADQNPGPTQQVPKNQTINITVYKFGGGGSPTTTSGIHF